jgi:insulysin
MVEDIVSSRNVTEDELVDRRMLLPSGKNFVNNQTVFNPEEKNNAILYTLQIGDATLDPLRGRVLLLAHMINEPAFNVLRTQEQLGYIVITNAWTQPSIISLTVRVQSERPPTYLENRIDAFLDSYGKELKNMTQKEFEMQRTGLVNKLREKLDNLDQEFYKFQYCILERTYDFFLRK